METLKYNYLHAEEELKKAYSESGNEKLDRDFLLKHNNMLAAEEYRKSLGSIAEQMDRGEIDKKLQHILSELIDMNDTIEKHKPFYKLGETMEQRKLRCHT
jgi:methionyl-tRNA synthetase